MYISHAIHIPEYQRGTCYSVSCTWLLFLTANDIPWVNVMLIMSSFTPLVQLWISCHILFVWCLLCGFYVYLTVADSLILICGCFLENSRGVGFTNVSRALQNVIVKIYVKIPEITFMVRISCWSFARVPKVWLWAHVHASYNGYLNHCIRAAKKEFYHNELNKHKNDIRNTWDTLKEIINKNTFKSDLPLSFVHEGV